MSQPNVIHHSVEKYDGVSIIESKVGEKCIIGEFSRIKNSKLMKYVKIDRNNFILESHLGNYSYTGNFTVIQSTTIGAFCSISWGVSIGGGEHPLDKFTTHDILYNKRYEFDVDQKLSKSRYEDSCVIGNDIWIGANSVILRGVQIGNGAVIGAGSVVTKDVPDYAIVAGNPSKILRYRFSKKVIERLLDSKWWELEHEILKKHFATFRSLEIQKFLDFVNSL